MRERNRAGYRASCRRQGKAWADDPSKKRGHRGPCRKEPLPCRRECGFRPAAQLCTLYSKAPRNMNNDTFDMNCEDAFAAQMQRFAMNHACPRLASAPPEHAPDTCTLTYAACITNACSSMHRKRFMHARKNSGALFGGIFSVFTTLLL